MDLLILPKSWLRVSGQKAMCQMCVGINYFFLRDGKKKPFFFDSHYIFYSQTIFYANFGVIVFSSLCNYQVSPRSISL